MGLFSLATKNGIMGVITAIFGGVSNKAYNKPEENSKTIYINGKALFGGVEIK